MTLLITLFAAIVSTLVWYNSEKARSLKISTLMYLFWGASLMWMVDAITEFIELKAKYFTPSAADMLNDTFLGLSVVALGLVIWIVVILVKDPNGVVRKNIFSK
ncbi:MAG: hypothetical protein K6D02_04980 [Lachnospiraceae bacterium]|nr:hypothetical protein [Lachnospiraceae bacterium]